MSNIFASVFFKKKIFFYIHDPARASTLRVMAAVRDFHSKRTCLLAQTSPYMKIRCSVFCTPASAASIRNPGYRPPYSYWLARPISMILRVQAHSGSWLLYGTFIAN